jgi:hypothetical protein
MCVFIYWGDIAVQLVTHAIHLKVTVRVCVCVCGAGVVGGVTFCNQTLLHKCLTLISSHTCLAVLLPPRVRGYNVTARQYIAFPTL